MATSVGCDDGKDPAAPTIEICFCYQESLIVVLVQPFYKMLAYVSMKIQRRVRWRSLIFIIIIFLINFIFFN